MACPSLSVSYSITLPPSHTTTTTASPSSSFFFPLDFTTPLAHLTSLEQALGEARNNLNEELTVWKEELRVTEKEKEKEGRKRAAENEDEEEEEEEEE
jgi:hypothetical protein